ncbi:hypothetical protein J6590_044348 [Homalodisca vitripennis]|nr:hypothetical protein J6590_044348 [Homalodisca vitripennis]
MFLAVYSKATLSVTIHSRDGGKDTTKTERGSRTLANGASYNVISLISLSRAAELTAIAQAAAAPSGHPRGHLVGPRSRQWEVFYYSITAAPTRADASLMCPESKSPGGGSSPWRGLNGEQSPLIARRPAKAFGWPPINESCFGSNHIDSRSMDHPTFSERLQNKPWTIKGILTLKGFLSMRPGDFNER